MRPFRAICTQCAREGSGRRQSWERADSYCLSIPFEWCTQCARYLFRVTVI